MLDILSANCSRILISLMCCEKCSFAFAAIPLQCINSFYGGCFLCMASTWSKRQLTIERFSEVTDHIKRIVSKTPTKIFNFWLSVEPATSGLLSPISPASPDNLCSPLHRTHLPFTLTLPFTESVWSTPPAAHTLQPIPTLLGAGSLCRAPTAVRSRCTRQRSSSANASISSFPLRSLAPSL